MKIPATAIAFLATIWLANQAIAESVFIQAESMEVDGTSWSVQEHFRGWYSGVPSAASMLRGSKGGQGTATKSINVKAAGHYRVWIRYLDVGRFRGPFVVRIAQGVKPHELVCDKASLRETDEGLKKWGKGFAQFVWVHFDAELNAGPAEITIEKSDPIGVSWITRHVDCLLLTPDLSYVPNLTDFIEPLYLRVTMDKQHADPCVIHLFGRRPRSPWYMKHQNLTQAGMFEGPHGGIGGRSANDPERFLTTGESTPWVNIVSLLDTMGFNRLMLTGIVSYGKKVTTSAYTAWLSRTPSEAGLIRKFSRSGTGADMGLMIDLTDRENIRSDAEWCKEAFEHARQLKEVPGMRPRKFPVLTSCSIRPETYSSDVVEMESAVMEQLGFSGLRLGQLGNDEKFYPRTTSQYYYHLKDEHCLNQPQIEKIHYRLTAHAAEIRSRGLVERITNVGLMDEPSAPSMDHIVKCGACAAKFRTYVKGKALELSYFGVESWDDIRPSNNMKEAALYYQTALFRNQTLADFFKIGTDHLRTELPGVRTTSNFAESLTHTGNMLSRGVDWFLLQGSDALTMGWTEDWLAYVTSYQLSGYRTDFLRAACRKRDQPFGMYNIVKSRSPRDIKRKAVTSIGHGASVISHFNYGPYYAPTSDQISHKYEKYESLREVNYAIGAIEEYLDGAKPVPSKIALLYSHTTDLWTLNDAYSLHGNERMGIYLLLRHLGYPVEIITEQEIVDGTLKDYEMVFLLGSHLQKEVVAPLSSWVKAGGRLYVGAGTGRFDELNRSLNFDQALSLQRGDYTFVETCGRAEYEFPKLKTIDEVSFNDEKLEAVCATQKLGANEGHVVATFSDGSPSLIRRQMGKGTVFVSGFFPGTAYCKSAATARKEHWAKLKEEGKDRTGYSAVNFPSSYRNLFTEMIEGVHYKPPSTASHPLVEANVLAGPMGIIITLVNWASDPLQDVKVSVTTQKKTKLPSSVRSPLKSHRIADDAIVMTLDLDAIDFIVLPYDNE